MSSRCGNVDVVVDAEANDMRGTHVCASMDKFKISITFPGVGTGGHEAGEATPKH
jgi:hypothetical protein